MKTPLDNSTRLLDNSTTTDKLDEAEADIGAGRTKNAKDSLKRIIDV